MFKYIRLIIFPKESNYNGYDKQILPLILSGIFTQYIYANIKYQDIYPQSSKLRKFETLTPHSLPDRPSIFRNYITFHSNFTSILELLHMKNFSKPRLLLDYSSQELSKYHIPVIAAVMFLEQWSTAVVNGDTNKFDFHIYTRQNTGRRA